MKNLEKTKFVLAYRSSTFSNEVLVYQSTYTKKSLEILSYG